MPTPQCARLPQDSANLPVMPPALGLLLPPAIAACDARYDMGASCVTDLFRWSDAATSKSVPILVAVARLLT